MRKFVTALLLAAFLNTVPINALAENGSLPKFELPKLDPLQMPSLSKDYKDMQEELKKEGFGQYKFDPQNPLPLPEMEAPKNAWITAYQKFLEEYGSINTHQLDKTSIIPDDKFFRDYMDTFKEENMQKFNAVSSADKEKMKELLNKKLDMSNLWNFDELKKQVQFRDAKSFLDNVPKPDGWDRTKANSFNVPDMNSWLNGGPKAEGYGKGGSFFPFLFERIKTITNPPTPPSPQPQAAPSFVPKLNTSAVPNVGLVPSPSRKPSTGLAPSPSKKTREEKTPALQPAPSFSEKIRVFGRAAADIGKKAAPFIIAGAVAAAACMLLGPAGLLIPAL